MLKGKTAIITGGSRGIGRECALSLARQGVNVVIAAKSTESTPQLPGSIYTVSEEAQALGVEALPCKLDLLKEEEIVNCVAETMKKFGRIDILVNNASALWWQPITKTPAKRYDLINNLNARGSFLMTKECLPHMENGGFGRVICMSPPITFGHMANRTAYNISKYGMTMVALGVAQEYQGKNILANALWPATIIESQASINFKLGDRSMWRKASILADAVVELCKDNDTTGCQLIDDTYLYSRGWKDMVQYRVDPAVEPPRTLDPTVEGTEAKWMVRGKVDQIDQDNLKSKL